MAEEDDVFNEVETEEKIEVETEKGAEEETKEKPEAKAEEETKEEPKEESPSSEDTSKRIAGLEATVVAERSRRQAAEAKVKTQEIPKQVVPDPVTDPEGYNTYLEEKQASIVFKERLDITEDSLEDAHEDYSEMKKIFTGLVSEDVDGVATVKDERLYREFKAARNPAKFLYNHAKKHQKFQTTTADGYEETLRQKHREEFIAEAKEKGISATELPDLTTEAASGSNTVTVEYDGKDDMWEDE